MTIFNSQKIFDEANIGDVLEIDHESFPMATWGYAQVIERTDLGLRMRNGPSRLFVLPEQCRRNLTQNLKAETRE